MLQTKDYSWVRVKYEVEQECKELYKPNFFSYLLSFSAILIVWLIDKLFSLFSFRQFNKFESNNNYEQRKDLEKKRLLGV